MQLEQLYQETGWNPVESFAIILESLSNAKKKKKMLYNLELKLVGTSNRASTLWQSHMEMSPTNV